MITLGSSELLFIKFSKNVRIRTAGSMQRMFISDTIWL